MSKTLLQMLKAEVAKAGTGENFSENVAVQVTKYDVEKGEVHGTRLDTGKEVVVTLRDDKDAATRKFARPDVGVWAKDPQKNKRVKAGEGIIRFDRVWEKNGKLTAQWGVALLHNKAEGAVQLGVVRPLPHSPAADGKEAIRPKLQVLLTQDATLVTDMDELKAAIVKAFSALVEDAGNASAFVRAYEPESGEILVQGFSRRSVKGADGKFGGWEDVETTLDRGFNGKFGALLPKLVGVEGIIMEVIPVVALRYGKNVETNIVDGKGNAQFSKPFELPEIEGQSQGQKGGPRYGFAPGIFAIRYREEEDGEKRPPFVVEVARQNTKAADLRSISGVVTPHIVPSAEALKKLTSKKETETTDAADAPDAAEPDAEASSDAGATAAGSVAADDENPFDMADLGDALDQLDRPSP